MRQFHILQGVIEVRTLTTRATHVTAFLSLALLAGFHDTASATDAGSLVLKPDLAIGVEDGDSTQMFGKILDAAVDCEGNIYVVDLGFKDVREYSESGKYLRSIGRKGPGPGEYDAPLAIDVDGQGNIVVTDFQRIHLYAADGTPITSFPHGSGGQPALSVAFGPKRIVLATWFDVWDQMIIHEYSIDGEKVTSFCESYAADSETDVREESSVAGGRIDAGTDGSILYAQNFPFELRIYTPSGELVDRITTGRRDLDEEVEFTPIDDGYQVFLPTASRGAIYIGDELILHTTLRRSHDDYQSTDTILELFNTAGELIASDVSDQSIVIMCDDLKGRVYGYCMEPYPMVVRYSLEVSGE
jgi:hypothetical protein